MCGPCKTIHMGFTPLPVCRKTVENETKRKTMSDKTLIFCEASCNKHLVSPLPPDPPKRARPKNFGKNLILLLYFSLPVLNIKLKADRPHQESSDRHTHKRTDKMDRRTLPITLSPSLHGR